MASDRTGQTSPIMLAYENILYYLLSVAAIKKIGKQFRLTHLLQLWNLIPLKNNLFLPEKKSRYLFPCMQQSQPWIS